MQNQVGGSPVKKRLANLVFLTAGLIVGNYLLSDLLSSAYYNPLSDLGYLAFPLFIAAVFLLVYTYSWPLIRQAWTERRLKWASWLAGTGFALFYVFATNMVSTPDPGEPAPPPFGFLVGFEVYGPMAMWPDIEFWSPKVGLFGYFSVGTVLLVVSLGLLASFAFALLIQSIHLRGGGRSGKGVVGSLGGALVTSFSTNACCCCSPLLLPLVSALVGETAATSLQYSLLIPGSPFTDFLSVINPSLFLVSILLSTRRSSECHVVAS